MSFIKASGLTWRDVLSLKGISAILAAGVLLACSLAFTFSYSVAASNRVVPGIKADGTPINGMTNAEVEKYFSTVASEKMHDLVFVYNDKEFVVKPEEIKWQAQVDKATRDAFDYGRGGSPVSNLNDQIRCALNGRDVKLVAEHDEELLKTALKKIAAQIDLQPANAFCILHPNGLIERIPGIVGKKLEVDEIVAALKEPLDALTLHNGKIQLTPKDIPPFVTTEDVSKIDAVIGQYTTNYKPGNRGDNIWIAANAISHKIVKTGWTFSFNDTVGARTAAAGYKTAGVIIEGRFADDTGGGVCQVSSTLYNAILLAGLTPTERTSHYFKSTYIGAGRDATVADGQIDFKFRNDLAHNVYLIAVARGSSLSVYVLGTLADLNGANISIEREGSEMSPTIYRVYHSGGTVVKSEFLHTDTYHKMPA